MDKINELFEQQINNVLTGFPSIYSNNDVINLLENLKINITEALPTQSSGTISREKLNDFTEAVGRRLDRFLHSSDLIDLSSAEFSINYHNQIELENIDVDTECITSELYNILDEEFVTSFPEFLTDNE